MDKIEKNIDQKICQGNINNKNGKNGRGWIETLEFD